MIKVMIVDDERLVTESIQEAVDWEKLGMEICGIAYNAKKAFRIFEDRKPELVITDIKMPGMDGLELARQMVKRRPGTQIVLLTAYRDFEYAKQAVELGASRYLLKNDICPESLYPLMVEIREEIIHRAQDKEIITREKCRRLLEEKKEDAVLQKELGIQMNRAALFLLLLPQDYFGERKEEIESSVSKEKELMKVLEKQDRFVCFQVSYGQIVLMTEMPQEMTGERTIRERMRGQAGVLQELLRESGYRGSKILMGHRRLEKNGCADLYHRIRKLAEYQYFLSEEKAYLVPDLEEKLPEQAEKTVVQEKEWDFERLNSCFEQQDEAGITEELEQLYRSVCQPVWRKDQLDELTDRLKSNLNDSCRKYPGIRFGTLMMQERESCLCAEEIRDCMARIYIKAGRRVQYFLTMRYSSYIRNCLSYVEEHYGEDISIDSVAGELGISGVYLSQLCRKELSLSFLELLTGVRMRKAKQLLEETQMKMYEIARTVGYGSGQYFASVFKRTEGVTPWAYRKTADGQRRTENVWGYLEKEND